MTDARVAVIVVSWNTAHLLHACLDAYDDQDYERLEVVVVDNASDDGSAELLDAALERPRRHPLTVVHEPCNRGFAGAVNDGLERTDAPIVVFSNVDVVPSPTLVSSAVPSLLADPRRGSVQPKLLRATAGPDGRAIVDTTGHVLTRVRLVNNRGEGSVDRGQYEVGGPVFGASGALVVHRRAMLDDVAWRHPDGRREPLTEDLFAYFEDVELDFRARLLGWDAWYEPTAIATHERGGVGVRRTATVEALNFANRLLVLATCDDGRSLFRAAPLVVLTTGLKAIDLIVTTPGAVLPAARRLRGLPDARRRRRQLLTRARRTPAEVVETWAEPFRFGPWVITWWRRIRGRSLGVARATGD